MRGAAWYALQGSVQKPYQCPGSTMTHLTAPVSYPIQKQADPCHDPQGPWQRFRQCCVVCCPSVSSFKLRFFFGCYYHIIFQLHLVKPLWLLPIAILRFLH